MILLSIISIIIVLGIISILARIIVYILNTILNLMSDNNTSEQTCKKKSNGCLYLIICIILLFLFIFFMGLNDLDLPSTKSNTPSSADHSYRFPNNDLSSTETESATPSSADHSYRSPNERSHRWIYDADTGIGYQTGESQCSILSLHKHAMGSNNPHWVTFMITQFPSSAIRIIISDGIYNNIADNQTITMAFSNTSIQVTGQKDGVKLLIKDSSRLLDAIKQSNTVTIPVKLKDGSLENLQFDLSSFTSQCPY